MGGSTLAADPSYDPDGFINAGTGTVGGGGDGGGDADGKNTQVNEMGGQGSGAPGAGYPVEQGPLGFGGAGNTMGGDGGYGGSPDDNSESQGGGGGGGGVGFGGGGGGEAGGGGAGYAGGSGSIKNDPSGGGGGSSFVAPTVDGGSALSSLATGEVTISYDPANDVCGLTTLYASATAAPASGGGASAADPSDLAEALLRVPAGGTVYLVTPGGATASSRYVGNWSVTTPGTSTSSPVTIEPLPRLATQPILDGDGPNAPAGEVCQTPLIPTGRFPYDPVGFPSCIAAVLTVGVGVDVDFEGTTIADGYYGTLIGQGSGGGLTADGQVMVTDDTFIDNDGDYSYTDGPIGAAAISVGGEASVTVTSSTFTGNSNVDDLPYQGGAISNISGGTLSVNGSTFTGNTDPLGFGGAIATTTSTPIIDSTFTDNSAARGGAVDGKASITNSTFTGNSASVGGAIFGGPVTVTDSTFSANSAAGNGGAIGSSALTVTDSTFAANTAAGNGGAISGAPVTVTDSTFSANTAAGDGGAVYSGSLTATDSTFAANTATDGGAIYGGSSTVTESTFAANTATAGGAIYSSTAEVAADIFEGSCDQAGGTWVDDGYNAGTDATCFASPPPATDVQRPHLNLGPLAAHGGPTRTVAPKPGSPVIGVIPASTTATIDGTFVALCPTVDQRGAPSSPGDPCNAGSIQNTPAVPLPTVTAVSPNRGPITGGQSVTVTGTGFVAGDTVEIGRGQGPGPSPVAATNVTVVSPTEITATTGATAKTGTWNLFVIAPTGRSQANPHDRYRYQKS